MSIEIDVLNGDASWPRTEPLHNVVWSPEVMAKSSWGHIKWENAHLRVLIDAPEDDGLACHVGIYFRTIVWNGHKIHVGGIGGVMTRLCKHSAGRRDPDHSRQRRGAVCAIVLRAA